ncbi:MAG TPA: uracil-DNA glycosylase [Oligoflexia bacterium]|nr:uracil-DNA glycosylase [Oligoflexia bacterium]HMR25592.1 uracil-DNA glycosylase [Oligoflexia bacterium]
MSLDKINQAIISCQQCPRLLDWQKHIDANKRASYKDELYWSRPVPSFGDPKAQILILGLAPGAHGANRTGRLITGDSSGDWLFRSMYKAGLCNQASSTHKDDGLQLTNTWISNVVHCAPPENKPKTDERDNCLPFLTQELQTLNHLKLIVCLGQYAYDSLLKTLKDNTLAHVPSPKQKFKHALWIDLNPYKILCSYHPSQQNTFTKKLTQTMLDDIFFEAAQKVRPYF